MAVFGYLPHLKDNHCWSPGILKGFEFLARMSTSTFDKIPIGESRKITLEGDDIYAMLQVYESKDFLDVRWESHEEYVDLQYVFSGEEMIYVASKGDARIIEEYDQTRDVAFHDVDRYSALKMYRGMVTVLFPYDIHAPGYNLGETERVVKAVVKVRYAL